MNSRDYERAKELGRMAARAGRKSVQGPAGASAAAPGLDGGVAGGAAMTWPFESSEQKAEYDRLRERGYALLRETHELFMAAVRRRKEGRNG